LGLLIGLLRVQLEDTICLDNFIKNYLILVFMNKGLDGLHRRRYYLAFCKEEIAAYGIGTDSVTRELPRPLLPVRLEARFDLLPSRVVSIDYFGHGWGINLR